jgi:hypothetical protein
MVAPHFLQVGRTTGGNFGGVKSFGCGMAHLSGKEQY